MKRNLLFVYASLVILLTSHSGCTENFLDISPEDKITSAVFWESEGDVELALNGIYSALRDPNVYGFGGGRDNLTINAHMWNGADMAIANGSLTSGSAGLVTGRWTACYRIISRANYFLDNIDKVELNEENKAIYIGEAHFLRGLAYALLAETYGGVPLILSFIGVEEARNISRASLEDTWAQVIADYDIAIEKLQKDAPKLGRATKGAAMGMKMRAFLYQNKFPEVLEVVEQIESLEKYSLFPSYTGLFQLENENNQEVIFDIQYIPGEQGQADRWVEGYFPPNIGFPSKAYVAPTQNLVDAYETIDGSAIDEENPYKNRDPRLDFTIVRPGAYWKGALYPTEAQNHVGQRVGFAMRKYTIETRDVPSLQSPLNFIVLRYADVILAKAEALIETNQNISEAIQLMNRIRTERDDVKITILPAGLSQTEARVKLRHERRIELAMEGVYWADIKRWNIGPEIYPFKVIGADGGVVETRFPKGYKEKDNLLPIPDNEISLNPSLVQNPGW